MKETPISIARELLGKGNMEGSARQCLSGAIECHDAGLLNDSDRWALRSIAYSVGISNARYVTAFLKVHKKGPVHLV